MVAMRFWVVWENAGNTPVERMFNQINGSIRPKDEEFVFDFETVAPQPIALGPGAEMNSGFVEFPAALIIQAHQGQNDLFLWGWAEYNDFLEGTPRHGLEFCFKVRIEGNLKPGECAVHFDLYGEHNGHYDAPPQIARS